MSSSSVEASAAGLETLRRGGNAVDAAVATAFALAVVDPSQTGLGGYASAVIWMRGARRADVVDGGTESGADPAWGARPAAGDTSSRRPRPTLALVPGFVGGLLAMHERHGKLPRDVVLAPAVRLARDGFVVGPLLHRHIVNARELLTSDPEAAAVFYPRGTPILPGERLVQSRLAELLAGIGRDGARAFYEGAVPNGVAAKVRAGGGVLAASDFAAYRAVARRPVCASYVGHTILGVGAPMAAHTGAEMLGLAELANVHALGDFTADSAAATRMADAVRVALADRRSFHGVPDWRPTPVRGMATRAYAETRLPLVGRAVADTLPTGNPWPYESAPVAAGCARHDPYPPSVRPPSVGASGPAPADSLGNTSHLSVIDAERNAVSMTTSIGVLWGSGVYAEGFWLNSSGNLFDASERGPRRRPSPLTMPMLALDGDDVRLAVGAAGGAYIGAAVAQVTVRVLGLRQDLYAAVAAPRFQVNATSRALEAEGGFAMPVYAGWRAHGYLTSSRVADLTFAAVHTVMQRKDGTLVGAADPRRDGAALGY